MLDVLSYFEDFSYEIFLKCPYSFTSIGYILKCLFSIEANSKWKYNNLK